MTTAASRTVWTPEQLAEALQVSRRSVYRRIATGEIRANRVGRRLLRVPAAEAERLLDL